jgi:hypothetical protein
LELRAGADEILVGSDRQRGVLLLLVEPSGRLIAIRRPSPAAEPEFEMAAACPPQDEARTDPGPV